MSGIGWSETEIAEIRAEALEAMQNEARILVHSSSPTAGGGQKETWTPAEETVPCRLAPLSAVGGRSGGEAAASSGDRVEDRLKGWITLPVGTEVTDLDRIEVIGGKTYEVEGILPRIVDQFVMRVDAREAF
jgi:hypothetical protein